MRNVETKVEGNVLTIKVDLAKNLGRSKSGKSILIASTEGNATVRTQDGREIKLGLNVYTPEA